MSNKLLLLALLLPLALGAKGDDEDDDGIYWHHPWLQTRYYDYKHRSWVPIEESDLGAWFERSDVRIEQHADGSISRSWSFVLHVDEPDRVGEFLPVAQLHPYTDTRIERLDLTWTSGGRTRVYDEGDLFEWGHTQQRYLTDARSLSVPMDRSSRGVLAGTIEVVDAPHPGFEGYFGGGELLHEVVPCQSRTITIAAPEGTELQFASRFFALDEPPEPQVEDGVVSWVWSFQTLYRAFGETQMPHWYEVWPSLWWSNQPSWEALGAMVQARWEPHVQPDPAITAWAREHAGDGDWRAQAVALHDAVAEGWEYLGFYPGASGWVPHPAAECLVGRIGDCKDRTALLVAGLASLGIEARPALVQAGLPMSLPEVPVLAFNHAVVWVDDPDEATGGFVLDSVDGPIGAVPATRWLHDRQLLALGDAPQLVTLPPTDSAHWLDADTTALTLSEDGSATATVRRTWTGDAANQRVKLRSSWPPSRWRDSVVDELLTAWPDARVDRLEEGPDPEDPTDTWVLEAELALPRAAVRQGPHAVLAPRWLDPPDPSAAWVDSGRRTMHLALSGTHRRSRLEIHPPPGWTAVALPADGGDEREHWTSALSVTRDGERVVLDLTVEERPGLLPHGQDQALRNFRAQVLELQRQVVVFDAPEGT